MAGGEPLASVLVPTHDHGPTLPLAVAGALRQTVADIEVLIVGDGMPPEAAAIARELSAAEPRVKLFEFEKGERHGEIHRDTVLRNHARGRHVLYLSDDDLWLPDHVEALVAALEDADFVGATAAKVRPGGPIEVQVHDLARDGFRELMSREPEHWNAVPLSAAGHTLAAYQRLDQGWSPAPAEIWTDLHFFRRFAEAGWARMASVGHITCISMPAAWRPNSGSAERVAELERWAARIESPRELAVLRGELDAAHRAKAAELELDYQRVHGWLEEASAHAGELEERLKAAYSELADARDDAAAARAELAAIQADPWWRLGLRLRRLQPRRHRDS